MAEPEPDHYEIAVEQYLCWREAGLTNREMLAAIGMYPPLAPDAETTVRSIAWAHRKAFEYLQRKAA